MMPTTASKAGFRQAANPGPLRLEIVESDDGFDALQPEWDALVDRMATRSPFVRWDWMRTWWDIHSGEFELCIAVARDVGGRAVGIAPFVLGYDREGSRSHVKQLIFLAGGGVAQGERMDFMVPAGWEMAVTPDLCAAFEILENRWDCIRLNHIPEESPNLPFIRRAMEQAGLSAGVLNQSDCRLIQLPSSWEEYAAQRPGNWRRNMERNWRQVVRDHGARKCVAGRDAAPMEVFDRLGELHGRRYSRRESLFIQSDAWRLHRKIAEKWIWTGQAVLTYIETDLGISAAVYGFVERGEFFMFQLGWDPAFARYSLGRWAVNWSIEHSIDHHLETYDLLPGEFRYKSELSDETRRLLDLETFHSANANASLFRKMRDVRRRCHHQLSKLTAGIRSRK